MIDIQKKSFIEPRVVLIDWKLNCLVQKYRMIDKIENRESLTSGMFFKK